MRRDRQYWQKNLRARNIGGISMANNLGGTVNIEINARTTYAKLDFKSINLKNKQLKIEIDIIDS